jgi:hypothetical protein
VDRALLGAFRAWGRDHARDGLARFPAGRRASLLWGWEQGRADDPGAALGRLRREHAAQARPDLTRVHVSWWVRALRDEPESVRRTVAAGLPKGLAEALLAELGLAPGDLAPDRPADPGAVQHALALWSAQFVGDLPERDDDPTVIAAVTRFDTPGLALLIRATGLAKWSLTNHPLPGLDARDEGRLARFRPALAGADPRFVRVAERDVAEVAAEGPQVVARAGLVTVARLLNAADPFRVRWALQHLPYATAKTLRGLMGTGARRTPMLARWETDVLRAAWDRLREEGLISAGWGVTL